MEDWEGHIYVSQDGTLPLYNYKGQKDEHEYHLIIPGCANPNHPKAPHVKYSDIGIKKDENGQWKTKVDLSGLPKDMQNFTGKLSASIAITKVKEIAGSKKNKETADFKRGKKRCIRLITPVEEKYRIHV